MQNYEIRLQPYVHKMSFNFMKPPTFKNKTFSPSQDSAIQRGSKKKYRPTLTLVSSENGLSSFLSQELLQSEKVLARDPHSQAENCIALIEDPLWKRVCVEFLAMMGPRSLLKISNVRLGFLCAQYKIINIYCDTKEEAEFVQRYSFVVLGSLQKYFPAVKSLIVRIKR